MIVNEAFIIDYLSREALFSEIALSTVYLLSTCIHARAKEEEENKNA